MRYKYGICGPFDFDEKGTGGQSVKTREFFFALREAVGAEQIQILESTDYKKNPFAFLINYVRMLHHCDHTIIFPAQNGIKLLAPVSVWFKGKGKTHYSVIGGWLPQLIREKPSLKRYLKSFDSILVETNVMKNDLESQGLNNVKRLLNFKRVTPVSDDKIKNHDPVRLCYFSRITKEKGIEDAIYAVRVINDQGFHCTFDIYGPVIPEYEGIFSELQESFPNEIRYCGKIAPEKSIETLKNYDIQLFPTLYPTEGIPGSIVDSYFAAVPVVAAKWNSFSDVVKEGVTGIGYEQGNVEDFCEKLKWMITHPTQVAVMKRNCLQEAKEYVPEKVIQTFIKLIS